MPVHDWSDALPGDFHDFHQDWSIAIKRALNDGKLPDDYYAMVEQREPKKEIDILTLRSPHAEPPETWRSSGGGGVMTLETAPPKVQTVETFDEDDYSPLANVIGIRHVSGDVPVAFIEIVSPGNKDRLKAVEAFCDKIADAVENGRHFLMIDILPPTPPAPGGMHESFAQRHAAGTDTVATEDRPLVFASYRANLTTSGYRPEAFINQVALGEKLPPMPVFLSSRHYVEVPLEETYSATWVVTPQRVRDRVLASAA